MAEKNGNLCSDSIKEAVCIDTKKIYDSCRDRDCCEDLRVYLTRCGQEAIDNAVSVRPRKAEVVWVNIDVEPITFNNGYYSVDVRYYFKVTVDAYNVMGRPNEVTGIATFDKKAIMFGSEGSAKIFSSQYRPSARDIQLGIKTNMPEASVEVVDPVLLSCKVVENCNCCTCCNDTDSTAAIPSEICACIDEALFEGGDKSLFVTLGLFTIIRLSRNVQLLIPAYDFCIPDRESECSVSDEPCDLFRKFKFPISQFFPPRRDELNG